MIQASTPLEEETLNFRFENKKRNKSCEEIDGYLVPLSYPKT